MSIQTYSIQLKDSVVNPDEPLTKAQTCIAHYRKSNSSSNQLLYQVWLYLEGKDLPFVNRVKYILHDSFRKPVQLVERTTLNQNCSLAIWTWGIFWVKAEVEDVKGRTIKLDHYLTYGKQIENKQKLGISFIEDSR
ncbi:MAG: pYEATS domain-containing protein [Tunicatimonas sp.]|uniref:pYEATS domain-containing protein n=1 Tax=Tunicatimonas sp. TaxID=1940096 RepID=UPI003C76B269